MSPPRKSSENTFRSPNAPVTFSRAEHIFPAHTKSSGTLAPGVAVREFASQQCGARGLSTGTATFNPGAELSYHRHNVSEAITVLEGEAIISVEGRTYSLVPYDCLHCPADLPHRVVNPSKVKPFILHSAFASSAPIREFTSDHFPDQNRSSAYPDADDPEHVIRTAQASWYKLAEYTRFCDLFGGRFGSVGICGGYGEFDSGSSLPCHFHEYDESITIVKGEAICEVMGRQYRLSGYGTAVVPQGLPHRFLNLSGEIMAMIWVYAGSEPERTIVNANYCTGNWIWKGQADD
jgi:quercetin dioxygenase-like cupin family protein